MRGSPVIAVTMGDLAGIGPEVVAKSLLQSGSPKGATFLILGDNRVLQDTCERLRIARRPLHWNGMADLSALAPGVYVGTKGNASRGKVRLGRVDRRWGRAAVGYVREAVQLAMEGRVKAIVTAPISKEAVHKAGYRFEGHTDLLAHLTGSDTVRMMFLGPKMKVVLATVHVPLSKVSRLLSAQSVLDTIRLGGQAVQGLGILHPRIAVCGLNPHAGEAGAFGKEEVEKISPACRSASRLGWHVTGPVPADGFFCRAQSKADLIVAMYHDQGLIPFKMLNVGRGVNTTLGLPFVRTSPDHGTAFDIAGKGVADHSSMKEAIRWALRLSRKTT
jgi:4-hydroxythreonine-4-phosphate dehydrogenase